MLARFIHDYAGEPWPIFVAFFPFVCGIMGFLKKAPKKEEKMRSAEMKSEEQEEMSRGEAPLTLLALLSGSGQCLVELSNHIFLKCTLLPSKRFFLHVSGDFFHSG